MPQPDQHNVLVGASQAQPASQQCWNELVKRLPSNLEAQARSLGAFQRVRAVPNAHALLRAVLCYVLGQCSLKFLSGWSRLIQVSDKVLSAQAWNKRLRQSGPWLLWLLTTLLQVRLSTRALPSRQRILLVDATHLSQRGPGGQTWRLHSAYDLLQGHLAWVHVSDSSQGEKGE